MLKFRGIFTIALAIFAVASSFAASVVGTWHGHPDFSAVKPPANVPPEQFKSMKAMMAKMNLTLTFKANKTYVVAFSGMGANTPKSETGAWSQSGNKISIVDKGKTQTLTVSKDGKSLTLAPPQGMGFKMIFTH